MNCRFRTVTQFQDIPLYCVTQLLVGLFGNRIPVLESFYEPVQTVPEAHPATCTIGTESFTGVKRPENGPDHPFTSIAEVREKAQL